MLFGVAVVVILFLLRVNAEASKLAAVSVVLALLAAGFSWFGVFNAGHSGANSVWHDEVSGSSAGGGESDDD